MSPIVMGIIIGVYIVCVIITAGLGFGLTGSLAEISRKSLWQCSDSDATVFDNNTCSGVDFAQYNTTVMVSSPSVTKLSKTLLISLVFERVGNWSTVLSTNVYVDVLITGMHGNETKDVVVQDSKTAQNIANALNNEQQKPGILRYIKEARVQVNSLQLSKAETTHDKAS